mmetsp:Transcript_7582/g.16756  ORF Transcript_7582/g.16756 Transcript_7582/m.16756 type:complete len:600 (-) Transcript_7582:720-2519(-)
MGLTKASAMSRLATELSRSMTSSASLTGFISVRALVGRSAGKTARCLSCQSNTIPWNVWHANATQASRSMSSAARDDISYARFSEPCRKQESEPSLHEDATAQAVHDGSGIQIQFSISENDEPSFFHASWLWANDPNMIHPTSGQRTRSISTFLQGWKIEFVSIIPPSEAQMMKNLSGESALALLAPPPLSLHPVGTVYQLIDDNGDQVKDTNKIERCPQSGILHVRWSNQLTGEKSKSLFDLDWLQSCRYDESALRRRQEETAITRESTLRRGDSLLEVQFTDWDSTEGKEDARFALLDSIFREGAALVKGAPTRLRNDHDHNGGIVGAVGRSLSGGALSHGNLYGSTFHVQSKPGATNIASTNLALPPHHDLVYYESKPGFQLLHCVNNQGVEGGSSTLVDALAAAGALRDLAPDLYETLLHCEATFVKQRMNADMVYRAPHIQEDSNRAIIRVNWSPPFQGPLCLHPSMVDDYVLAYAAFERLLDKSLPRNTFLLPLRSSLEQQFTDYAHEYTWEQKLEVGDILVFSNQRMLHGRESYRVKNTHPNAGRHLVGCYTNIDDTLNEYRLLRRKRLHKSHVRPVPRYIRLAGNGSSGTI